MHETSRRGVSFGIAGMALAIAATGWLMIDTTLSTDTSTGAALLGFVLLVAALLIGAVIGLGRARVGALTGMPALIELLPSFDRSAERRGGKECVNTCRTR